MHSGPSSPSSSPNNPASSALALISNPAVNIRHSPWCKTIARTLLDRSWLGGEGARRDGSGRERKGKSVRGVDNVFRDALHLTLQNNFVCTGVTVLREGRWGIAYQLFESRFEVFPELRAHGIQLLRPVECYLCHARCRVNMHQDGFLWSHGVWFVQPAFFCAKYQNRFGYRRYTRCKFVSQV